MKFSIKHFFSKCDQIRSLIFCAKHNGQFILDYKDDNHWASLQCLVILIMLQSTIMDLIFWDFVILYQIFFSPQVKRSVIVSNKHGIHKLPLELPHKLRLRILGTQNSVEL